VLFDFSLSRTPADKIQAGTRDYMDPFLQQRERRQWDLYAERYAAAITLYEMATGTLPQLGRRPERFPICWTRRSRWRRRPSTPTSATG